MRKKRIPSIACPHCGSAAGVRSSEEFTPLCREARLMCENIECGHIFVAQIAIVRTIAPSMIPNPAIDIPIGNQNLRRRKPSDNDNMPPPDNDNLAVADALADTS